MQQTPTAQTPVAQAPAVQTQVRQPVGSNAAKVGTSPAVTQVSAPKVTTQTANQSALAKARMQMPTKNVPANNESKAQAFANVLTGELDAAYAQDIKNVADFANITNKSKALSNDFKKDPANYQNTLGALQSMPTAEEYAEAGLTPEQVNRAMASLNTPDRETTADYVSRSMADVVEKRTQDAERSRGKLNKLENFAARSIAQGLGQAPQMILNMATGGIGGDAYIAATSFANAYKNAEASGLDGTKAAVYGLINSTIETASNHISSGFKFDGKGVLDDWQDLLVAKSGANGAKAFLLRNALNILGEQIEEEVATVPEYITDYMMLNANRNEDGKFDWQGLWDEAVETFIYTFGSTLFLGALTGEYSRSAKADFQQTLNEFRNADDGTSRQMLTEAADWYKSMDPEQRDIVLSAAADTANVNVNEMRQSIEQLIDNVDRNLAPTQQNEIATAMIDNESPTQVELDVDDSASVVEKLQASVKDLKQMDPVISLEGTEFDKSQGKLTDTVGRFFRALGNLVHRNGLGDVVLDNDGIKSDIGHGIGREKAITFAAVPAVIEKGKVIDYQKNWKNRNYDTYVIAAPVDVADHRDYVGVVLYKKEGDSRFYLHEVVDANGNVVYKKSPTFSRLGITDNVGVTSMPNSTNTIANTPQNSNTENDIARAMLGRDENIITEFNGQPIYRSLVAQDLNTREGRNANEISALARALGRNVEFAQALPRDKNGNSANGMYINGNNVILDEKVLKSKKAALSFLFHEVTHSIGDATSFSNFVSTSQEQWKAILGDKKYNDYFDYIAKQYAPWYDSTRSFEELKNDAAFKAYVEEELTARYVEEKLFKSQEEINRLVNTSRSTAQRLWQSIKDTLAKLTGIDSKEVAELKRVERMFAKALSESNQNRESTNPFFSLKSMMSDISDGQMYRQLIDSGVFSEEQATDFVNKINRLMDLIEPKRSFLDINEEGGKEDRVFHPFKQNSDRLYQVSMDFSTLCKKRIITQAIIEKLNMVRGRALDAKTQFAIEQLLRQKQAEYKGLQVACALCYVEAARLRSPKVINQFLDNTRTEMINALAQQSGTDAKQFVIDKQNEFKEAIGLDPKANKKDIKERLAGLNEAQFRQAMSFMDDEKYNRLIEKVNPFDRSGLTTASKSEAFFNAYNLESRQEAKDLLTPEQQRLISVAENLDPWYFLTADGQTELKRKYPEIYRAYNDKVRSATRAKALETNVPYYFGDSQGYVSDELIKMMNEENGLRTQSWSDMQLEHILDNITAIAELSTRGAKMHGYTKVPEFVEVLGRTGLMANLSLIPEGKTGLDPNGELIFSPTEGMRIEDALRLRDKYSNTAGTICIGVDDNQILKMMDSDIIDYIIPYHVSGLTKHMRTMAGIGGWKNYQNYQNEREINNPKKAVKEPINFSDWFSKEYYNDPRPGIEIMHEAQQKYLDLCAEKGYIPKFEMFLQNNGDGSYSVPLGADGEPINYWKVLIDRKMIDQNTGDIIEQQPVKPDFVWEDEVDENGDTIKGIYSIIEEAEDPRTQDMVDDLTDYVESAMDAGVVDAIARNDPQVQRMVEEFDKTHLTPEQLLETAEEDEWNGDIKDGVSQSQPVTMPRNAAARFSLPSNDSYNGITQEDIDNYRDEIYMDYDEIYVKDWETDDDDYEYAKYVVSKGRKLLGKELFDLAMREASRFDNRKITSDMSDAEIADVDGWHGIPIGLNIALDELEDRINNQENANKPRFSFEEAKVPERRIDSIANSLKRKFNTKMDVDTLKQTISELYDIYDTDTPEDVRREVFRQMADEIERQIPDSKRRDAESQTVLERLKEQPIRLSEDQISEIKHTFGSMKDFRREIAPLKIRSDGIDLESAWREWADSSATLGMVSEDVAPLDMPMELADLVEKLKGSRELVDHEDRIDQIVDYLENAYQESVFGDDDIDLYEAANGGWKGLELTDPTESAEYKDLIGDGEGAVPLTDVDSTKIAQQIQGNRKVNGFDTLHRVLDRVSGGNTEVRTWLENTIEKPLYNAKAEYTRNLKKAYDSLDKYVKETGIKAGTEESAAAQWYGEGYREVDGKRETYGLKQLKEEFPDKWKDIVEMEKFCRYNYMRYVERINAALEQIYPDVEQRALAKLQSLQESRDSLVDQARSIENHLRRGEVSAANSGDTLAYVQRQISELNQQIEDQERSIKDGSYLRGKRLLPRNDYFHHFNQITNNGIGNLKNLLRGQMTLIDTDLIGKSESTKPKTKWMGFLQRRGEGAYTADAVGGMARYMPGAEFVIAMDPAIAHMRAVISELVRSTKNTRNANGLISYLTNFTNDLCGKTAGIDRSLINMAGEVDGRSKIDFVRKLNQRFKANAVGGNIRSALAQFSNIPTAMGVIKSDTAWMKGMKDYLQLKTQGESELLNQSNFMAERYFDSSPDRFAEDTLGKKIKDFSNAMLEFGDREAAQLIWFSAYNEGLEKGVADPIYYADVATQQSVGGRGIGEVPYNMNTKVVNLLAPFQVEVNNTWQQLKKMVGEKDAKGLMRYMVGSFVLESLMEQVFGIDVIPDLLGTILDTIMGAWKEKDEEEPNYRSVITNGISNAMGEILSAIPGINLIAQVIAGVDSDSGEILFGENSPSRYGTGLGGIKSLTDLGADAWSVAKGEKAPSEVDLFSPLVESLMPFGGRQITRTYQSARDLGWMPDDTFLGIPFAGGEYHSVPGSYTNKGALRFELPGEINSVDDASELARALLLGEYSTKAGREYLETRKPMVSATKMEKVNEYADAGYDPKDYIEFLANADTNGNGTITQAEAQEYLDSTDLDNDQKLLIWTLTGANWKKNPYK